jgi:hypothetical protein
VLGGAATRHYTRMEVEEQPCRRWAAASRVARG